jgi:hypothetical protein
LLWGWDKNSIPELIRRYSTSPVPWDIMSPVKPAQQILHWMVEILRHFRAFFWLRVFPALKQSPRPRTRRWANPLGVFAEFEKVVYSYSIIILIGEYIYGKT